MPLTDEPTHRRLIWPTLHAIQELGGSASRQEVLAKVASGFPEDEQAEMMPNGRTSRLHYYTGWSLTGLKRVGVIDNSRQGVWALTERGRGITEVQIDTIWDEMRVAYRALRLQRQHAAGDERDLPGGDQPDDGVDFESEAWKDELLNRVRTLTPSGFERLCQRLLREEGVEQVEIRGGAGDQGIDGVGVARLGLLSFPVYFQAKRYAGAVTPGVVRDFRGAMAGRGEKGLLITTASFTAAAYGEATRDGVTAIDLIDSDRLCDLLKDVGLGVNVVERKVEDVTVNEAFWEAFD